MIRIALAAAAILSLAACARDEPEPTGNTLDADAIETGAVNDAAPAPPPPAPVVDDAANVAEPEPVEAPIDEPAQVQDDADASGMTSRIDRTEEAEETAANETAAE